MIWASRRLDPLLGHLWLQGSCALVGIGHPEPGVTLDDLAWRRDFTAVLNRHGIRPIDFFTADLQTVTRIPEAAAFVA